VIPPKEPEIIIGNDELDDDKEYKTPADPKDFTGKAFSEGSSVVRELSFFSKNLNPVVKSSVSIGVVVVAIVSGVCCLWCTYRNKEQIKQEGRRLSSFVKRQSSRLRSSFVRSQNYEVDGARASQRRDVLNDLQDHHN